MARIFGSNWAFRSARARSIGAILVEISFFEVRVEMKGKCGVERGAALGRDIW